MGTYSAPVKDMLFLLKDVFDADNFWASMPSTADVNLDLAKAILEEAGKISQTLLYPLNRSGDEEGASVVGQGNQASAKTPSGFKEAFKTYAEGGWCGIGGNPEFGGQGMPKMITALVEEMFMSANTSFALYPVLSAGACLCLDKHASEELKQIYLEKIYEGTWSGTMCLTEPSCGTDLGIMQTRAVPQADGSYSISGTKIFITGGDHDLTDNIIHLVLAKLPDAPAGSRGISLFLVPKFFVNNDGSLGDRNGAYLGSIEHKMGIKGSATCVMNFDNAKGWLIGEINQGLAAMFTMMNYERLTIGLQGLGAAEMAYQLAVDYAKDRLQSRRDGGAAFPDRAADPIIVHGDVRRMLLNIRSFTEAGRAFSLYAAQYLDLSKFGEDKAKVERAQAMVALLTPIAKAYFSDRGLDACIQGQQVFGGHGYIREWGAEQLVRDVRIAQIYEGTNGIQALDLVLRKVLKTGGKILEPLFEDIDQAIQQAKDQPELAIFVQALAQGQELLQATTVKMFENAKADPAYANGVAVDYLDLAGLVVFALMWTKIAQASLKNQAEDSDYYSAKITIGKFFVTRVFPKAVALAQSVQAKDTGLGQLAIEQF